MSEVTSTSPRRSGRVFHKMRVQAQGRSQNGRKFRETCETVVVNAHGGLLLLKHEAKAGEMLGLTNPGTQEGRGWRVAFQGDSAERGEPGPMRSVHTGPDFR